MRRMVITAADSAFGMKLLSKLAEQGLGDFEWIFGTWFDAKEELDQLLKETPSLAEKMILKKVDMRSVEEIDAFCLELSEKETATDFIHLPAPKAFPMQFKKLSFDVFRDHMEISFRSAVLISQTILPAMAKKKEGRVLLMSSYYATEEGTPNFLAPYVSAKSAILGLMRSLAKEYGPKNLKINAAAPDFADTKYLSDMPDLMKETVVHQSERGRMLSADEVIEGLLPYLDPETDVNGRTIIIR
ncbi:MAG: SDR family oxidoreductase [Parasporobacterium sp.]|nr:SDR family oxidoreductase [Parasporobacterium sp.]